MSAIGHSEKLQSRDEPDAVETEEDFAQLLSELGQSVEGYCRKRPGVVAGILFGLGFFCGWKLRPW